MTTLRGYGISGEVVIANPARPAMELARAGIAKGYDTIVAIGGDQIINAVASTVQSTHVTMGIVPIEAHPRIANLIGNIDPIVACEALRHRRIDQVGVTFIDPGRYFITEARIEGLGEIPVRVHVDDVVMETTITRLSLFGDGTIEMVNDRHGQSVLRRTVDGFLGRPKPAPNVTHLTGQYLKVETKRALPVRVGKDTIARTPFVAAVKPRALKLITARAIVAATNSLESE